MELLRRYYQGELSGISTADGDASEDEASKAEPATDGRHQERIDSNGQASAGANTRSCVKVMSIVTESALCGASNMGCRSSFTKGRTLSGAQAPGIGLIRKICGGCQVLQSHIICIVLMEVVLLVPYALQQVCRCHWQSLCRC